MRPVGEIEVMGPVGVDYEGGISAASALSKIKAMSDVRRIKVTLNSPGGSAFDGVAIYNALKDSGKPVDVHVIGLAASAASIIAMAGDTVTMHEGAMMMIHRAWVLSVGDANTMRDTAAKLEKLDGEMAGIYAGKSGRKADEMLEMMSEETWFNGDDAIEAGLATERKGKRDTSALKQAAAMLASLNFPFLKTPETLRAMMPAASAKSKEEAPIMSDTPETTPATPAAPAAPVTNEPAKAPETPKAPEAPAITPEAVSAAANTAIKAERERVSAIMATAKALDLADEAQAHIDSGATPEAAKLAMQDKKIKALQETSPNVTSAPEAVNVGAVKAFEDAVAENVKAGMKPSEAVKACIKADPKRHAAYIAAANAGRAKKS